MLINKDTAISTSKILLVPYSESHVPVYHEWMKDEDILAATASEPLTFSEEHAMQQSWRTDSDKLTFIACLPISSSDASSRESESIVVAESDDAEDRMLGDINLFLTENDEEEEEKEKPSTSPTVVGELELMIASKPHQGHGYGRASLLSFLNYIVKHEGEILAEYSGQRARQGTDNPAANVPEYQFRYLRVKVGHENHRSINLFESVGFTKVKEEPNFFGELELRLSGLVGSSQAQGQGMLDGMMSRYGVAQYEEMLYSTLGSRTSE
ncbi:MAG: hypothetical protein M1819_001161 [Sarea resinae]|nr:MAG: hypothetical protein M1819_001161 [Sarea resinae]